MTAELHQVNAIPGTDDTLRVELENGIVVLARENFNSPAVVVDGILRNGALFEPPEKAGLASFHASLLTRGTQNYTFGNLFEEIESNGASLDVHGGRSHYAFGTKSLAEDLPRMLNLLSEVFRKPTFLEEYVERVRIQNLTRLKLREQSTRSMASLKFFETAYQGHPYAISTKGYPETVTAITRDDIVRFQGNMGPQEAIIVIVGAVKAEDAVQAVRDALGDWENPAQPELPPVPEAPTIEEDQRTFFNIPGKSQADIVLGFAGPPRSAEDFIPARIANSILGRFGMYGRLGDNIREKQGLAYYSYSKLSGGYGPGPWQVNAGVAPENIDRAVKSIVEELHNIVEEPVTDEELSDNKSYFKGGLVLGLETNEGVASTLLAMEMYDLGLDYLQNYDGMIDALTVEDVQKAAQHYIKPEAYTLAVAGPLTQ